MFLHHSLLLQMKNFSATIIKIRHVNLLVYVSLVILNKNELKLDESFFKTAFLVDAV